MKKTMQLLSLFILILLISGCANNLSMYDEDGLEGLGSNDEEPVEISVNYLSDGAEITVKLNYELASSVIGLLNYDKNAFNIKFSTETENLCKFNTDNLKVACASSTFLDTGNLYTFKLSKKSDSIIGQYPLGFEILEIDGNSQNTEIDTFINIKN
ncbi:hypothetical protein K9L67_01760 [Candidatus Woesearchaeota archaeon]|nr:hypothetical protein [Candidatus Woesearchaeota archaeon]MCF7900930.1 hypothetical protein [Candidatus Woesearchaeota archaeon]MCF8012872.1 hypothetical protein [Candidatus Woesearchaeota archaeon]